MMMRYGLGVLGWPPRDFWSATAVEVWRGVEGFMLTQGVDVDAPPSLTRQELEELVRRYE